MVYRYDELMAGLDEVARRAASEGLSARIHIVGGTAVAALTADDSRTTRDIDVYIAAAIATDRNRTTTQDVDTYISTGDHERTALLRIAAVLATERGWPEDWLNTDATMFLPDDGEPFEWQAQFSRGDVSVVTAPADLLLAMKLRSNRGRRDTRDLAPLIDMLDLASRRDVEVIFDRYFPNDVISDRSSDWLESNGFTIEPQPAAETAEFVDEFGDPAAPTLVYIDTHLRGDRWVNGHWRKRR